MKYQKIIFISALLGVFLLIVLSQTLNKTQTGAIKSIQYSNNKITIYLENESTKLVIFISQNHLLGSTDFINLKKGDTIEFQGKDDIYRGKTQIIIDKILKKT